MKLAERKLEPIEALRLLTVLIHQVEPDAQAMYADPADPLRPVIQAALKKCGDVKYEAPPSAE